MEHFKAGQAWSLPQQNHEQPPMPLSPSQTSKRYQPCQAFQGDSEQQQSRPDPTSVHLKYQTTPSQAAAMATAAASGQKLFDDLPPWEDPLSESFPDPMTNLEGEHAEERIDLLKHTTISRDQTSTSARQSMVDRLTALKKRRGSDVDHGDSLPLSRGSGPKPLRRESTGTTPYTPSYEEPPIVNAASMLSSSVNDRRLTDAEKRKHESQRDIRGFSSLDALSKYDLIHLVDDLDRQNQGLNAALNKRFKATPKYTWQTLHCLGDSIYLEPPQWLVVQDQPHLRAETPLQDEKAFLQQHPEIAFVYYSHYTSASQIKIQQITSKDGVFQVPKPSYQSLSIKSKDLISALKRLITRLSRGSALFSRLLEIFDPEMDMIEPYVSMYHALPHIKHIDSKLYPTERDLLDLFYDSILAIHGREYEHAKRCAAEGNVTRKLMKYLIRPGDVLVHSHENYGPAYMVTSWAEDTSVLSDNLKPKEPETPEAIETLQEGCPSKSDKLSNPEDHDSICKAFELSSLRKYSWKFIVWTMSFNGSFQKQKSGLTIDLEVKDENDEVPFESLNILPLRFDKGGMRAKLEQRGKTFWKCRGKQFVSYEEDDHGDLNSTGERYMIDIQTYKVLHPESFQSKPNLPIAIGPDAMAKGTCPGGDTLLLFPPRIKGFNLRLKKWVDLFVDRISEVTWNKQAFESLVVDEKKKELVEALVTNRLNDENSTDLMYGKGHGLIILLHGGPGVGKTFTAEGVAEMAEKPLYRVTCGDVGTKPEEVEKYLESVLYLGKTWDCVVLLDEADVFLEERGLADLQRNALVSVFLRVLEYNVGILILTSNRVGTFDEAFKSRIQLALHYENLTTSQQRKIWRNFLNRVHNMDASKVDFDDIIDNIDELAKHDMNGRQIRNAITTARQLAQFKKKKFCYEHLKHVIQVGGEFETYLKNLREGFSDDQIKRGDNIR